MHTLLFPSVVSPSHLLFTNKWRMFKLLCKQGAVWFWNVVTFTCQILILILPFTTKYTLSCYHVYYNSVTTYANRTRLSHLSCQHYAIFKFTHLTYSETSNQTRVECPIWEIISFNHPCVCRIELSHPSCLTVVSNRGSDETLKHVLTHLFHFMYFTYRT